jgi:hypothetical protein
MARFTSDHKFSRVVSQCFADMGLYDFINPISSQPWGGRSRTVARIRVYEKYLTPDDVLHARWIHRQAKLAHPREWQFGDKGIEYINTLLDERSAGGWHEEMEALAKSLPTAMGYAMEAWPLPSSQEFARMRRAKMHIVPSSSQSEVSV